MIAMRSIDEILSEAKFLQTTEEIMAICNLEIQRQRNIVDSYIYCGCSFEIINSKLQKMKDAGFHISHHIDFANGIPKHYRVTFKNRKTVCKHIFGKKITNRYSSNGKPSWSYIHTFYDFLTYCENLFLGKGA